MPTRKRSPEHERMHHCYCVMRDTRWAGAKRRAAARGLAIVAASNLLVEYPIWDSPNCWTHPPPLAGIVFR
jgi:hypothetical protein